VRGDRCIAVVNVPLVHFSVVWWRTPHQPSVLRRWADGTIPPMMLTALLVAIVAFTLLWAWVVVRRAHTLGRAAAPSAAEATADHQPREIVVDVTGHKEGTGA
jgi:heme exporter protein C